MKPSNPTLPPHALILQLSPLDDFGGLGKNRLNFYLLNRVCGQFGLSHQNLIYYYLMKTIASSKMDCYPKAKLIGLALSLLVLTFPAMGEVTTSKVDIPVVGSKCNERVKEVGSVSGVLRFPSKALGKVPAVVLLHSNAGIVGVGDFYARSLNAVGIVVCSTDCFRVEAHKRLRDKTGSYRCNSDPRPCKSPKG